ncbi:glycosyltransferase family 2 protein [Patescibacteria group bacterium]|nr:glycosyltransferase family 2 protein [Patescibacteria group bacterium]MBU1472761.1 glycosyltransferase family 2 protein [Patescibacteria group bacterium]MBU2460027.1 glycosyltransferase family 2 protein [Patescibacteria group bacterium]MBU2544315.1 glycosyltransferase family 2 protein [Patescibacteria group bacterium]
MSEKKKTISIALAVYNEEQNIRRCLSAVCGLASEIVVVDGGSRDNTVSISKEFGAKVIKTDNPPIFHINKQKALDACLGEWILQLDADEVVTPELREEILKTIRLSTPNGYYIPRKNFFCGHWLKKGGQYPDYVIRLVRNGFARFPCKSVHEQIEIQGNIGYLKEPLQHFSYKTKEDYWRKADSYTTLTAQEMKTKESSNNVQTWIIYMVLKPLQTFLSLFIRHKGFIDGWYGLIFAYWSALHFPIAYKKYRQMK